MEKTGNISPENTPLEQVETRPCGNCKCASTRDPVVLGDDATMRLAKRAEERGHGDGPNEGTSDADEQ